MNLATAAVIGLLAGFALDYGAMFRLYLCSLGAYGFLFMVIACRRGSAPTRLDLLALKWGFLVLFTIGLPLSLLLKDLWD